MLKSFYTIVIITKTSSSYTLGLTGIALVVIPKSTAIACGLSTGNKVIFEIVMRKYNKYNEQYEKDKQTLKSFDKLYRKSLQDNVVEETECERLCNIFTKYVDEMRNQSFL